MRSKPHFFKVFFPERSGQQLTLPPAFSENLADDSSGVVSLKGPSGYVWRMELIKSSTALRFSTGWKEFAADHRLQIGDFLVFCYDGPASFSVLVFDPSACEKETSLLCMPGQAGSLVADFEQYENLGAAPCTMLNVKRKSDGSDGETFPRTGESKGCHHSSCKEPQLPSACSNNSKRICTRSGQRVIKEVNDTTQTLSSPKPVQLRNTLVRQRQQNSSRRTCRTPTFLSRRRPVTQEEINQALERACGFETLNPSAIVVMMDSYVYVSFFMHLPSQFVREHLRMMTRKVILWDPEGRKWEVNLVFFRNNGAFSAGWSAFALANNLEKHDACVFELIDNSKFKVHIFRVVNEITPLVRTTSLKGESPPTSS